MGYLPSILGGALVTLEVALLALALAITLGLSGATARLASSPWLRWPAVTYTTLVRGVPDLVMMLLVFYGGQVLLNEVADALEWEPVDLDPFIAGVLTIGFIFGAYFTETFRGAIWPCRQGNSKQRGPTACRAGWSFVASCFHRCCVMPFPELATIGRSCSRVRLSFL